MKKTTIITILFLFSNFIFGQSLNDLDLKNGFRHFKLGSSPSQFKNIKKIENPISEQFNAISYKYIGDDINYVGGVKVVDIKLDFFKNKLTSITVNFGEYDGNDFTEEEFRTLRIFLENIYGKEWLEPKNKNKKLLNSCIWDANKIRLELNRFDFNKAETHPENILIVGYILVFDKKLMKEMISENF